MEEAVGVSVIIPTFRRRKLLRRCLEALFVQQYPKDAYEVIVCDDATDLATRELVERLTTRGSIHLRYVPVTKRNGPAAARNVGWRAAKYDIIAFTDDDTIPDPLWIYQGARAISGAIAVAGRVVVPLPPRPTDYERNESGLDGAEFVTANCFCRREVLEAVGGFDEEFTSAWREDSDLYFRLLQYAQMAPSARIVKSDEARVTHPVRPAGWGVSLKQQKKSMFDALLYRKHPGLYRTKIAPRPPWRYYTAVIGALVGLAGTVFDDSLLAVSGWTVWILVTTEFCMRRLASTTWSLDHVAEMIVTSAIIPFLSIYWRLRGAIRFGIAFM